MEHFFIDFLKAVWIGGTLTVPGVSGGTMAMVLGVYERLVNAVNGLRRGKERRKNTSTLLIFGSGGLVGIFTLCGLVSWLLSRFPVAMICFFTGAVAGGVPVILNEMKRMVYRWYHLLYPLFGAGVLILISMIPAETFSFDDNQGVLSQMVGGIIAAIALVLPGISVSHMLYILGIYDGLMRTITNFEIIKLIPFGIGLILGVLWSASGVEYLLVRFKKQTYLLILGFVIASVFQMISEMHPSQISFVNLLLIPIGYFPIYYLFKYSKTTDA